MSKKKSKAKGDVPNLTILDQSGAPLLQGLSCDQALISALDEKGLGWLLTKLKDKEFIGTIEFEQDFVSDSKKIGVKLQMTTADGTLKKLVDVYEKLSSFDEKDLILLDGVEELRKTCAVAGPLATELWREREKINPHISVTIKVSFVSFADDDEHFVIVPNGNALFAICRKKIRNSKLQRMGFASVPTIINGTPDELLTHGLATLDQKRVTDRITELEELMVHPFRMSTRNVESVDILLDNQKEIKLKLPDELNEWTALVKLKYKHDSSKVKNLADFLTVSDELKSVMI